MPIYAYRCATCGETFEKIIRSTKSPTPRVLCPACNSRKVTKLVSAPRVIGSDFGESSVAEEAAAEASAHTGLFGRKELNAVTSKRKKAGLAE